MDIKKYIIKEKMETEKQLDLDAAAAEVCNALVTPIKTLAEILKKKLQGSYGQFELGGWIELKYIHRAYLIKEFPGHCRIESADPEQNRVLVISLKFSWGKWDNPVFDEKNSLDLDLTDQKALPNQRKVVSINALENQEFIQSIKDWLAGSKKASEIPWETWK